VKVDPEIVPSSAPFSLKTPPESLARAFMLENSVDDRGIVELPKPAAKDRSNPCSYVGLITYDKPPTTPLRTVRCPSGAVGRRKATTVKPSASEVGRIVDAKSRKSLPTNRTTDDPFGVWPATSAGGAAASPAKPEFAPKPRVAWLLFPDVSLHVQVPAS